MGAGGVAKASMITTEDQPTSTVKKTSFFYLSFLAVLAMLGYFASDMYLPAFPAMKLSLATSRSLIELTLSVYMAGLAIGQIFYGTISDRFGRKYTLAVGLFLFLVSSLACAYTQHINTLLFWRVIQALGACATTVLWQAMVIDRYGQDGSHRIFAIIFPLLGVSPAIAPSVGGFLTEQFDWRSIFIALALIGLVIFIITLFIRETSDKKSRLAHKINIKYIWSNYKTLFGSIYFMGYVTVVCLATSCFFAYMTGSPFALKLVGYTPHQIGVSYIPQTLFFMLGGFISKKVSDRISAHLTLTISIVMSILCGAIFVYYAITGVKYGSEIIIPFLLIALANGMIYPTCMAIALNKFPKIAGTAAGLSGFLQAAVAFIASSIVASLSHWGLLAMGSMILILSVLNIGWYLLVRRLTCYNR